MRHNIFPQYVKPHSLLCGILILLLREYGFELCHTRNQAVVFLRAHQSVCFLLVAFLESSHDLGRFGASRLRFWRGHGFRIGYISVGRMGPRVGLPALDFVSFRGHGVLCLLVRDVFGDRPVSDTFR